MDLGKTVGLVGIGVVGTAIAENLLANGLIVVGFARREVKGIAADPVAQEDLRAMH